MTYSLVTSSDSFAVSCSPAASIKVPAVILSGPLFWLSVPCVVVGSQVSPGDLSPDLCQCGGRLLAAIFTLLLPPVAPCPEPMRTTLSAKVSPDSRAHFQRRLSQIGYSLFEVRRLCASHPPQLPFPSRCPRPA